MRLHEKKPLDLSPTVELECDFSKCLFRKESSSRSGGSAWDHLCRSRSEVLHRVIFYSECEKFHIIVNNCFIFLCVKTREIIFVISAIIMILFF